MPNKKNGFSVSWKMKGERTQKGQSNDLACLRGGMGGGGWHNKQTLLSLMWHWSDPQVILNHVLINAFYLVCGTVFIQRNVFIECIIPPNRQHDTFSIYLPFCLAFDSNLIVNVSFLLSVAKKCINQFIYFHIKYILMAIIVCFEWTEPTGFLF